MFATSPVSRQERYLPREGVVEVWHASFSLASRNLAALATVLSPEERGRARRYAFSADRRRSIISRGLLRHLIAQYLRVDPHEVTIGVGKQGKPFISHP